MRRLMRRRLMSRVRRVLFHLGGALDGLLHLLEGPDLDLADALARDAELGRKVLERHRILGEAAGLEDAPLAIVQRLERVREIVLAKSELLGLDETLLLIGRVVDEPILPFAGIRLPRAQAR